MALYKTCRCGEVIPMTETYCDDCKKDIKDNHSYYKKNRNDKAYQAFYIARPWRMTRKIVLQRDNFLCQLCLANGDITVADVVHHVVELKEDESKATDKTNLIALCNSCHKHVHNRYNANPKDKKEMQKALYDIINEKY